MVNIKNLIFRNNKNKQIFPQIYLYSDKYNPEWVKVGYTTRQNVEDRIKEQYNTLIQLVPDCYMLLFKTDAVRYNGVAFTDRQVHMLLDGLNLSKKGEFYKTDLYTISKAILDIKKDISCYKGLKPCYQKRFYQIPKIDVKDLKIITRPQ